MRVLIIHHLEKCWESGYCGFGLSFERLQEKFVEFLQENSFDRIILTRFEDWKATPEDGYFPEFLEFISEVRDYAYGWDKECTKGNEERFCVGGTHSDFVLIDDWMLKLRGCDVTISGAFDGECVEDLEIALSHLGIEYKREENLII